MLSDPDHSSRPGEPLQRRRLAPKSLVASRSRRFLIEGWVTIGPFSGSGHFRL